MSPTPEINKKLQPFFPRKSCTQSGCLSVQTVSYTLKISLLSGVSYPERGYDLFLTAAVADGAKLWDLRQDRNLTRLSQLTVQLCICLVLVLGTLQLIGNFVVGWRGSRLELLPPPILVVVMNYTHDIHSKESIK